jgi:uncharacterized phage protein gp47/JayE
MATTQTTAPFTVPTTNEIRDSFLRTLKNGLIALGVTNPNVQPGSEFYIEAQALANELAPAYANIQVQGDEMMPDTASIDGLQRWGEFLGLPLRTAQGSAGFIVSSSSSAITVSTGAQLIDGAGLRYEVSTGGIYNDGDYIPIAAVDTGTETNLATNEPLRWVATPPFSDQTVYVAPPGLANGTPDEDTETYRSRILARLANPPGTGNASHVISIAEASDGRVQKAFAYPAYQGPGTLSVAVVAAPTATNKSRQVNATVLSTYVEPYIVGQMPEHVDCQVTTVQDQPADVAIGMTLPEQPTASPPGPGGGWKDASPWPQVDNSSVFYAEVTAVTSTTEFSLTAVAGAPPVPGVTRVCFVSTSGTYAFTLYEATVTAYVESPSGTYTITLDSPFVGISVGNWVFPAAEKTQEYVDAILTAMALMGPGEKRTPLYGREYRRPVKSIEWLSNLGAPQLRAVSDVGDEVLDVQYLYRSITGAGVPASATDAPFCVVPQNLGLYRLP